MRRTHLVVRPARAHPARAAILHGSTPWPPMANGPRGGAGRGLVGKGDASLRVLTSGVGAFR